MDKTVHEMATSKWAEQTDIRAQRDISIMKEEGLTPEIEKMMDLRMERVNDRAQMAEEKLQEQQSNMIDDKSIESNIKSDTEAFTESNDGYLEGLLSRLDKLKQDVQNNENTNSEVKEAMPRMQAG